ncbi:hypothetical protein TRVA0_032S00672 [Trichomonascus vanleenenianus]|uniref:uncharacterized protein n=1 Tax=Trichomonascus vanleenenianus TaxID=2268995 RepID=UPI003ECB3E2C
MYEEEENFFPRYLRPLDEVTIRSHIPPSPGEIKAQLENKEETERKTKYTSVIEKILHWPPTPGQDGQNEIKIKVHGELVPPKENRQRLFVVQILAGSLPLDEGAAVAEVFDPFTFVGVLVPPSIAADNAYSHTVLSYELLAELQGKIIPKYYGSYTMTVPVDGHLSYKHREVRLILRDYIRGSGLDDVNPISLNRDQRQILMEKVVEAEDEFYERGVSVKNWFDTQCVILADRTDMQIVAWNFANATFSDGKIHHWRELADIPGQLSSPVLRWKKSMLEDSRFSDFVDWPWGRWLREKYKSTLSSITEWEKELVFGLDDIEPEGVDRYISTDDDYNARSKDRAASQLSGGNCSSGIKTNQEENKKRGIAEEEEPRNKLKKTVHPE